MVNWKSKRLEDFLKLGIGIVLLILVNMLANRSFYRFDLTEEGKYSIKEPTKEILRELNDVVYVEVFLDGALNSGFKRLQRNIRETLEEFRVYAGSNIQYVFNDPSQAMSQNAKMEFMQMLVDKGIQPTNIIDNQNGQRVERLVFPGAIVSYGGVEKGVMLLKGNQSLSAEQKLNQSIENIEYELASAIQSLSSAERKTIGVLADHGVPDDRQLTGFLNSVSQKYLVKKVGLKKELDQVAALVIPKPTQPFSEQEKYNLDQYLMQGGKLLLLIDKVQANMDSANRESNYSFPIELNLDDQFFKYGFRVNNDLIQDNNSGVYPIVTGNMGDQPQVNLLPWPFFPLLNRMAEHPITKNINAVSTKFLSSVDTIVSPGIKKTGLLRTSEYSRRITAPVKVSIQDLRKNLTPDLLNEQNIAVGWLLEGSFTSLYHNRFKPEGVNTSSFVEKARPDAKIAVIGDGDLIINDVNPTTGQPQPLGFDPFLKETFANEELLMNALSYLVDEDGLILARNKEIKLRPLNKVKIAREKFKWQIVNLVIPIVLLVAFGIVRFYLRKRKYTH